MVLRSDSKFLIEFYIPQYALIDTTRVCIFSHYVKLVFLHERYTQKLCKRMPEFQGYYNGRFNFLNDD